MHWGRNVRYSWSPQSYYREGLNKGNRQSDKRIQEIQCNRKVYGLQLINIKSNTYITCLIIYVSVLYHFRYRRARYIFTKSCLRWLRVIISIVAWFLCISRFGSWVYLIRAIVMYFIRIFKLKLLIRYSFFILVRLVLFSNLLKYFLFQVLMSLIYFIGYLVTHFFIQKYAIRLITIFFYHWFVFL